MNSMAAQSRHSNMFKVNRTSLIGDCDYHPDPCCRVFQDATPSLVVRRNRGYHRKNQKTHLPLLGYLP
jgi:hypothetical protein